MKASNSTQRPASGMKSTAWYFYNASSVQQGKQMFERKWGKRDNADDWQRSNKTVVSGFSQEDTAETEGTEEPADSIDMTEEMAEGEKELNDSWASDPHNREYYLAQIPFTPEQIEESNTIIKEGLFQSAIIFKDRLDNLALSEKSFMRLINDFPEFEPIDEVYYHLFLLYSRKGDEMKAKDYIEDLKSRCPDSKWTAILTDPYFEENARYGEHLEDSLYAMTYDAFIAGDNDVVKANTKVSDSRFPLGANRDKFLFISGLSLLNEGDADGCLTRLKQLIKEFPTGKTSEMAGMIINGVNAGKRLHGAKFSMTDVWNRRNAVMADSDSIATKQWSMERDVPFTFMLVYEPDSVDSNRLLFILAKHNFSSFIVRNFEMELTADKGLQRMNVKGFRSHDEARLYARVLYQNEAVRELAEKCRPVIIADENIPLLGETFSYNEYDSFYVAHFQPLEIKNEYMLYEPDAARTPEVQKEITPVLPSESAAPKGVAPVEVKKEEEGLDVPEDADSPAQNESYDIPAEASSESSSTEEMAVPVEEKQEESAVEDEFVINENSEEDVREEETVITDDTATEEEADSEDGIIFDDGTEKEAESDEGEIILEDDKIDLQKVEDEYYELEGF